MSPFVSSSDHSSVKCMTLLDLSGSGQIVDGCESDLKAKTLKAKYNKT